MEIAISPPKLTKQQAEALDEEIIFKTDDWFRSVQPLMIKMRDGSGYEALGYKTFREYCGSVDERLGYKQAVSRLVDRIEVESNLGVPVIASHAYTLAKLPTAEAQREVFKEAMDKYQKPIESNYQTLVEHWLKAHKKGTKRSPGQKVIKGTDDGWSDRDLEEDSELATALDRIENVYSLSDRKSIQDGTIGLSRKDIVGLAAFHATKMSQVQQLIMANHWDLETCMKFVNKQPDAETTVHELQNHCLTTPGFFYTCQVDGFDITVKACKALTGRIKG